MSGKRVFLIFDYHEHGPETIFATQDESDLPPLLESKILPGLDANAGAIIRTRLEAALKEPPDVLLKGVHIVPGWGGFVLLAVPLFVDREVQE